MRKFLLLLVVLALGIGGVLLVLGLNGCTLPFTNTTRTETLKEQAAATGASNAALDLVTRARTRPQSIVVAPQPEFSNISVSGKNNILLLPPPASQPFFPRGSALNDYSNNYPQDEEDIEAEFRGKTESDVSNRLDHTGSITVSLNALGYAVAALIFLIVAIIGVRWLMKSATVRAVAAFADREGAKLTAKVENVTRQAATAPDPGVHRDLLAHANDLMAARVGMAEAAPAKKS